jgi:hypothetical protein
MTSAPSEIIPSSINNLTVWYDKRAPISNRLHLFGRPSRYRIPHNDQQYDNRKATPPPILFLLDCDCFREGSMNRSVSQNCRQRRANALEGYGNANLDSSGESVRTLHESDRTLRDGSFGWRWPRHFVPGYDRAVPPGRVLAALRPQS